jgi:hypothetical protein
MIAVVGDEQVAEGIEDDSPWVHEISLGGRCPVTEGGGTHDAGDHAYRTAVPIYFVNHVAQEIGRRNPAFGTHGDVVEARNAVREGADSAGGVHHLQQPVAGIGDKDPVRGVYRYSFGLKQLGADGESATAIAGHAGAGKGGDDTARCDLADPVVEAVGDVQVAGAIEGEPLGRAELRGGGGQSVAGVTGHAGTGHGRDNAVGADAAHHAALTLGEKDVAGGIHCDACGRMDPRGNCWTAIARVAVLAVARDGVKLTAGDLAEPRRDSHVEISGRVDRDRFGVGDGSGGGRPTLPGEDVRSGAGHHRERASGIDFEEAVVVAFREVEIAGGVERDAVRREEVDEDGRFAIAGIGHFPMTGNSVNYVRLGGGAGESCDPRKKCALEGLHT